MGLLTDLENGKAITPSGGGSYSIQSKEGADFLILNATDAILQKDDLEVLQRSLSIMGQKKAIEAKL